MTQLMSYLVGLYVGLRINSISIEPAPGAIPT
jgi:hypothetical protein